MRLLFGGEWNPWLLIQDRWLEQETISPVI
jgi:hypothetical protein